jgi:uncharacterized protein
MKQQLEALITLQQVDSKLHALNKELSDLDAGTALKQQIAAAEVQEKKLQEEERKAETELRDAELNLKSIEQKKSDFEKKLYGGRVSNPKELGGIEKEIEMLGHRRSELDGRILELYDEVDKKKAAATEFSARIAAAKARLHQTMSKYEEVSRRLAGEVAGLDIERAKLVEGVDAQLLRRYDSIRKHAGGLGIVKVTDGKCGGCHIGLTGFLLRRVRENTEPQFCENCGRFLVAVCE